MEKYQRLVGIDLFRGIAAYAVVILHSDEGISGQSPSWTAILSFSAFAVPFFLATSFYLTVSKLYVKRSQYNWRLRLNRLLIPYGFWSVVYLLQKLLKYLIKHEPEKIGGLFQDPLGLIFLGQSAFHLYFIPLLLAGTLLVPVAESFIHRRIKLNVLLVFLMVSLIIYQSYRAFVSPAAPDPVNLNPAMLGQLELSSPAQHGSALAHVMLVLLGYMVRCLPYMIVALLLNHPFIQGRLLKFGLKDRVMLLAAFLVLNAFTMPLLPSTVHELLRGYAALLLALALSSSLQPNVAITSVSRCSLGIYLMHLLIVEACWSFAKHLDIPAQISVLNLLVLTTLSFLVSWLLTSLLIKQKPLAKLMFGV